MPVGPWELAIILVIIVIIFGVGKLPEIGGALGKGIREFKESSTNPDSDVPDGTVSASASHEQRRAEPTRNETVKEEL
jgi:sec-independent protein translocase protein TatA